MQERGDGAVLVEAVRAGEGQRIYPDQIAVGAGRYQPLDGGHRASIGPLSQRRK